MLRQSLGQGNVANQHAVEVYNPVNEAVRQVMQERRAEYSSTKPASIWVGTFNVNGRTPGPEDLLQWLWPTSGGRSLDAPAVLHS